MNPNAVAITGIGMICPLGVDTPTCWKNMLQGTAGIRPITKFDPVRCLSRIGGELPEAYPDYERARLPHHFLRHGTMSTRLALLSSLEAMRDAALDPAQLDADRAGVITGCGGSTVGDALIPVGEEYNRRPFAHGMLNAPAAAIRMTLGFRGPSFNVATACASGAYAVGLGYDYIRRHGAICVAVGVDTMLSEETVQGFSRLMALSELNQHPEKASRPFDRKRTGFVLSEGACAVILESLTHAVRRAAPIYAVMSGHAMTSEAFNIIAPEPDGLGMAETMEKAIVNAGIQKDRIGYINAHGTSTVHNDRAETSAIKAVFGKRAWQIPVSSQKSMIGHTIGAAGAIEVAVTALSLRHQVLTPTINYEEPDPECDLDYVPNQARSVLGLEAAISNSFGFGGHNSCIVLERYTTPAGE
ncbi:beta-ketoacyl-[acyl-carrier-protein] synthase family protein [Desulfatiglans anilini]|uniref:beta-ketoacyl-[acyl-carrier-protein] synthase family protein n=1 Tax=Desulfatiglans anilini TaxID=90728 RepID=UPI0004298F6F|nr:beta-ketoacyl-[acyl-carrier-protein] synthase family protein [Desulfatiglans anilini]